MMAGGASPAKPADQNIQEICDKIRADLESKSGRTFDEYVAHSYSSQVVAGSNYFVKIHVGNESYVHARIFMPLPCNGTEPELHSHQLDKTKEDAIGHF